MPQNPLGFGGRQAKKSPRRPVGFLPASDGTYLTAKRNPGRWGCTLLTTKRNPLGHWECTSSTAGRVSLGHQGCTLLTTKRKPLGCWGCTLSTAVEIVHPQRPGGFLVVNSRHPQCPGGFLSAVESVHPQRPRETLFVVESVHPQRPRGFLLVVESVNPWRPKGFSRPSRMYTLNGQECFSWPLRVYTLNDQVEIVRSYSVTCWIFSKNRYQVPHLAPPGGYQRYFWRVPPLSSSLNLPARFNTNWWKTGIIIETRTRTKDNMN
jgi:hypothetical protein